MIPMDDEKYTSQVVFTNSQTNERCSYGMFEGEELMILPEADGAYWVVRKEGTRFVHLYLLRPGDEMKMRILPQEVKKCQQVI